MDNAVTLTVVNGSIAERTLPEEYGVTINPETRTLTLRLPERFSGKITVAFARLTLVFLYLHGARCSKSLEGRVPDRSYRVSCVHTFSKPDRIDIIMSEELVGTASEPRDSFHVSCEATTDPIFAKALSTVFKRLGKESHPST